MRTAGNNYVNYQERAREFAVGDRVFPLYGSADTTAGRVVAVWPSIGMVDVQWPNGSGRYPVEDLNILEHIRPKPPEVGHDSVPGGTETVPVSEGPPDASRVAKRYMTALYWASKDRHYSATQTEIDCDEYTCPKCKDGVLQPTSYKRQKGANVKLLACPTCLFLIKPCDIVNHDEYVEDRLFGGLRL